MRNTLKVRKRYARQYVDQLIKESLERLKSAQKKQAFIRLANTVRERAWLFETEPCGGRVRWHCAQAMADGLIGLAEVKQYWIREPETWQTDSFSARNQFASLARHLLATHPVPRFMDYVWWTEHSQHIKYRKWFRHLAQGNGVRGLGIPELENKAAVQRFLNAPGHMDIREALAWCQKPAHEKARSVYPIGLTRRRAKRTVGGNSPVLWKRIGVDDFSLFELVKDILNIWRIQQIRHRDLLREEGREMNHCVFSYVGKCESGRTTIWSMKRQEFNGQSAKPQRALTVEVTPDLIIREALGKENRDPNEYERMVLNQWATRENLKIAAYV